MSELGLASKGVYPSVTAEAATTQLGLASKGVYPSVTAEAATTPTTWKGTVTEFDRAHASKNAFAAAATQFNMTNAYMNQPIKMAIDPSTSEKLTVAMNKYSDWADHERLESSDHKAVKEHEEQLCKDLTKIVGTAIAEHATKMGYTGPMGKVLRDPAAIHLGPSDLHFPITDSIRSAYPGTPNFHRDSPRNHDCPRTNRCLQVFVNIPSKVGGLVSPTRVVNWAETRQAPPPGTDPYNWNNGGIDDRHMGELVPVGPVQHEFDAMPGPTIQILHGKRYGGPLARDVHGSPQEKGGNLVRVWYYIPNPNPPGCEEGVCDTGGHAFSFRKPTYDSVTPANVLPYPEELTEAETDQLSLQQDGEVYPRVRHASKEWWQNAQYARQLAAQNAIDDAQFEKRIAKGRPWLTDVCS